ncbi:MAG: GNAT family N-acetyltransferase [Rhodospirillales bacterium]|nr:GNAT family N-acetyltransferase [Rhodospirillales bacterium]
MVECSIDWNNLSLAEWQDRFGRIRRANLLQSYDYARAICPLNRQKARWGLIKIKGVEAGLVQILEAGVLKNLIHGVILDCGPLWFDGYGTPAHSKAFFTEFSRRFPRRFGRRRRIIPAAGDSPENRALFVDAGYERQNFPGYQTIWIDLTQDEEELRSALKAQWRNKLNKGPKAGLKTGWNNSPEVFSSLLRNYSSDRAKKGYAGPSLPLLRALAQSFGDKVMIGHATLDNRLVAAILILCHGTSATYQIGWSSDEGRNVAAHNALLWQAVLELKKNGFRDFDLGGINGESAKHVKKFKQGMGGQELTLVGCYR